MSNIKLVLKKIDKFFAPDIQLVVDDNGLILSCVGTSHDGLVFIERELNAGRFCTGRLVDDVDFGMLCIETVTKEDETE